MLARWVQFVYPRSAILLTLALIGLPRTRLLVQIYWLCRKDAGRHPSRPGPRLGRPALAGTFGATEQQALIGLAGSGGFPFGRAWLAS